MNRPLILQTATALLAGALVIGAAVKPAEPSLAFTSITVVGTNLVLRATVPAHLKNPSLEARENLTADWHSISATPATAANGELEFTVPKLPGNQFLRLRASDSESSILNVVTVPALKLTTDADGRPAASFHFAGRVDGSDKMLIKRDGVFWEHVNWGWPEGPVAINGTSWDPTAQNYAAPAGGQPWLPPTLAFDSATVKVIKGRDVVALERTRDGLMVYINDTPGGPDDYEFTVTFHPPAPTIANSSPLATLKISADIDGSDCLHLTANQLRWEHLQWAAPPNVTLNGENWNVTANEVRSNLSSLFPANVDLASARIVSRSGRDLATLWATKDEVKIYFADNPNGSDTYDLAIGFGPLQ